MYQKNIDWVQSGEQHYGKIWNDSMQNKKKEDPTLKIGQKTPEYGKRFMALKDISFEVEKEKQ